MLSLEPAQIRERCCHQTAASHARAAMRLSLGPIGVMWSQRDGVANVVDTQRIDLAQVKFDLFGRLNRVVLAVLQSLDNCHGTGLP